MADREVVYSMLAKVINEPYQDIADICTIFFDHVALAKQGDNALGIVCLLVCLFVCLSVCAPLFEWFSHERGGRRTDKRMLPRALSPCVAELPGW